MAKTWLRDERKEIAILVISSFLLISLSFLMALIREHEREQVVEIRFDLETIERLNSQRSLGATPIIVSEDNPFYALIATPVALYYEGSEQYAQPLLVQDFENPSPSVCRFKNLYPGMYKEIRVGSLEEVSIDLSKVWKRSDSALIIENSQKGYEMGIVAVPLASYLNIPVFVTDDIGKIETQLRRLGI